jgi:Na+/H+-translocating membrane pyrophosphatase
VEDPETLMSADTLQLIILPAGIIAVLFALYLARDVLSRDTGTKEMEDVAGTIFEGAVAFIRRQYTTIAILATSSMRWCRWANACPGTTWR